MNGISVLIKEDPQGSLASSTWGHNEKMSGHSYGKRAPTQHTDTLILNSQPELELNFHC